MKLPIKISPNPIVASTVEIRFASEITSNQLFPLVYSALMQDLPNVQQNKISDLAKISPQLSQLTQQLKYAPEYILSNDSYKLSFSNSVLSFENIADYKLWGNYFPFISKCINIFFSVFKIDFIERIGIRYASILDKTDGAEQALNFIPTIGIEGYKQKFNYFRSLLTIEDINLLLQIQDQATLLNNDRGNVSGLYIDIDASYNEKLNSIDKVLELIDKLHSEEKKLFFSLFKQEYINTLNPEY